MPHPISLYPAKNPQPVVYLSKTCTCITTTLCSCYTDTRYGSNAMRTYSSHFLHKVIPHRLTPYWSFPIGPVRWYRGYLQPEIYQSKRLWLLLARKVSTFPMDYSLKPESCVPSKSRKEASYRNLLPGKVHHPSSVGNTQKERLSDRMHSR